MCYIDFIYSNIYYFIAILAILFYIIYSYRHNIRKKYNYFKNYNPIHNENHASDGDMSYLFDQDDKLDLNVLN